MTNYCEYAAGQMAQEKVTNFRMEAERTRMLKQVIPSFRIRLGRILVTVGRKLLDDSAELELIAQ